MGQLKVWCFGDFEVRLGGQQVTGFESQKVRALLAYLAAHRDRALGREHLAALLWGEKDEETARRNLRQAIYNLRSALGNSTEAPKPILATHHQIQLNPELGSWIDVVAFEESLNQNLFQGTVDPHRLAEAVTLYRGEFLGDLLLKDSPSFEQWMLAEQERLRERVIEALRLLADSYLARGEFRLGIQYARRLAAIDPLSEEAHRHLMRLYVLSGRRTRALQQYEELRQLLAKELEVEPQAETRELYEDTLAEKNPLPDMGDSSEPAGPIVPLVGRDAPYRQLHEDWQVVTQGRVQLTVVTGETGIGKTRLVKSFLGAASFNDELTVLKGACDPAVPLPFQPFPQVLANAAGSYTAATEQALASAPVELLSGLLPILPGLESHRPDLHSARPEPHLRPGVADAMVDYLELVAHAARTEGSAMVLLLDDLQHAPAETFTLLDRLLQRIRGEPIWVLALARVQDATHPLVQLVSEAPAQRNVRHIELDRLRPEDTDQIAHTLLDSNRAQELNRFLWQRSDGLPLAIAEWVNFLWDEGVLTPEGDRWHLTASLPEDEADHLGLPELLRRRLMRLPSSARRLAIQASVMGRRFEAMLLQRAADEHPAVVEIGLELLLERWLVRPFADAWTAGQRRRDLDLWALGARNGHFEFSHQWVRDAFYGCVGLDRRQAMHGRLAETLEQLEPEVGVPLAEDLAHHWLAAGQRARALEHLLQAASRALALQARDTAAGYHRLAAEVLAEQGSNGTGDRERMARLDLLRQQEQDLANDPT